MRSRQHLEPARSPERQRLADAVERHRNAVEALDRVTAAQARLHAEFYDQLAPDARNARMALDEAREAQPQAIVSRLMGDAPGAAPSVADAERALAEAEHKIAAARDARSMLDDEERRCRAALDLARMRLDDALKLVVSASPELSALRDEFERTRKRMSALIGALAGAGVVTSRVAWHEAAFVPAPAWVAALSALREDADAQLPSLPEDEPEHHADRTDGADKAAA